VKVWGLSTPAPFALCIERQASAACSLVASFSDPKAPYKSFPLNRCRCWEAVFPCLGGMHRGAPTQAVRGGTLRVVPMPSAPRFQAAGPCTSDYTTALQTLHHCRDGWRRQRRAVLPSEGWRLWRRAWLGQDAEGHWSAWRDNHHRS